jgi:membrane protein required for colicin V production
VGIFVAVLLLAGLLARAFARLVHASGLGLLDRVLGTVFGFARALLIIGVALFVLRQILPPTERDLLSGSQLLPYVDLLLDWALSWFEQLRANGLQLT